MGCFDCVQRWSRGNGEETERRVKRWKEAATGAHGGSETKKGGRGEEARGSLVQIVLHAEM